MNANITHRDTNQSLTLNDRFQLSDRDRMDYLSEPEELDVWSINDMQDVLTAEITSIHHDYDYGWDDNYPIDQTHVFLD